MTAGHTVQRDSGTTRRDDQRTTWRALLRGALTTPGLVHEAYARFHRYSLRNQLLALAQCEGRGLAPGPLATFRQWQALGRFVRKGEKALTLCVPLLRPRQREDAPAADECDEDAGAAEATARPVFVYRRRWFVLGQTDGEPYEELTAPCWNEAVALAALGIERVPFVETDGNMQGYSVGRAVAINPVAALPHKTLFHELAHVVLGHTLPACHLPRNVQELEAEAVALLCCEALGVAGAAYSRGYVQHWATSDDLTDAVASRIMTAADTILRAGRAAPDASPEVSDA
jgi:antirestriction protein ArdC